jgi:glycosyltransferase involved in cell wall biosynthesis
MKLSVAMIVKNEAACIARCLESVRDADEIILLDTGSIDYTAEVVASLNLPNVVFIHGEYEWRDDFAEARNNVLRRCSGDWILSIDADETLAENGIQAIRKTCQGNEALCAKIRVQSANSSHLFPRILKNSPEVFWKGRLHEAPTVNTGPTVPTYITYGTSEAHLLDPDRNMRILTKAWEDDPTDTRTLYYLAREYWYLKDYSSAIPLLEQHTQKSTFKAEQADAYLYLARMYWQMNMGDHARNACMNAIMINANFKEALLFMATLSFPKNGLRWNEFARLATNEDVLFIRT